MFHYDADWQRCPRGQMASDIEKRRIRRESPGRDPLRHDINKKERKKRTGRRVRRKRPRGVITRRGPALQTERFLAELCALCRHLRPIPLRGHGANTIRNHVTCDT